MSLLNWSYSQCLVRDLIDIWSLHVPIIDFFLQTQSSIRKIHANLKISLKMSWSELFFYAFINKKTKQNTLHMYKLHRNTDYLMHCKVSFFNCNSWSYTYVLQWYMYISSNVIVYKHFVLNTCSSYAVVDSFV